MHKHFLILLVWIAFSCTPKVPVGQFPKKLIIGLPVGSEAEAYKKFLNPAAEYLKKTLNLESVNFYTSSDYATIIEAMKAKKVDIAYFGELSYIIAHEKAGADALVMFATNDGSPLPSESIIITYPGSGIRTMDDIKKRSHELTLIFSDPASTSGHLYPRDYLTSIGLQPEKSFKQVMFSDGHSTAMLSIKAHKVDLACTSSSYPIYMMKKGKLSPNDYIVVWKSKPYPTAPISIRHDLPEDFKNLVKKAYIDFSTNDPENWHNYIRMITMFYPDSILEKIVMVEAADSTYDPIRRMAEKMSNSLFKK